MKAFILACAACSLALPAFAQSVVGRAVVDGKAVSLFDDNSWAYSDAAAQCEPVAVGLDFCGESIGWKVSRKPSPDYTAAYRLNDRIYGGFIIENVGTDLGLTMESTRALILDVPLTSLGSKPVIIDVKPVTIGAETGETMVYSFKIEGMDVVYANSVFLSENRVMQALTYEIGASFSDAHQKAHDAFVAATRYNAE